MMPALQLLFGPALAAIAETSRDRILKHPLRKRILEVVERSPGILPQVLGAALQCNRSTVRYHLAVMQAAGVLRIVSWKQRAHLFATTLPVQSQDALAVLQRGRTWELAREVARAPGQPQRDLTNKLQMSRKILRKYVDRLLQAGLIKEVEEPPFLTYFPASDLQKMVNAFAPQAGKSTFQDESPVTIRDDAAEAAAKEARPVIKEEPQLVAPEIKLR